MSGCFLIGFILITLFIIYHKPNLLLWSLIALIYLGLSLKFNFINFSSLTFIVVSVITLFIVVFFNIKQLRQIFSRFLYSKARTVIGGISETEKQALDAGDSWFEKEIFQGKPNFKTLHNIPKYSLTDEENAFLNNEVVELCNLIEYDRQNTVNENDLSVKVWKFIKENKFLGLVIKKKYGGKGFSAAAHSEIVLRISTRSVAGAITVMVPNSLGPGELLYYYGTDEQKNKFLPRLAAAEEIPCFALTGPTAGSDATSIPDKGIVCYGEFEGKSVLGIKLIDINKRYITLAPISTLVGLAFKLFDPENLLGGVGKEGITCALLPHTHNGLEIGNRLNPLNQSFMNGTIRIKESFIPIDWIIGGQKMAGEGWRMLVECLSIGRSISLPACGTGASLFTAVMTSSYALIREQFNTSIGNFEGVEEKLARIGGLAYMANATRQFTVGCVDKGVKPSVASAISKYHLTEIGRDNINSSMDIHGGRAVIIGPNNYLSEAYFSNPISITVEGANIMTRNLLIFGQGMMQCHPYLRTIFESIMDTNKFSKFDDAVFSYFGSMTQNKVRAFFHGLTAGMFACGYKSSKFNCQYKKITRLSSAFSYITDLCIFFIGGELKRKERVSARLGDAMSYLYMACATLKFFKDNGERESDVKYVKWVLEYSLYNTQLALVEVLNNFPNKFTSKIVKFFLFPYGLTFKKPTDYLESLISKDLLSNSETRKMFKSLCYIPSIYEDTLGRMEVTYLSLLEIIPIKSKIYKAVKQKILSKGMFIDVAREAKLKGIIEEAEFEKVLETLKMVNEVIQVDEYGPFDFGPKNAHPQWNKA